MSEVSTLGPVISSLVSNLEAACKEHEKRTRDIRDIYHSALEVTDAPEAQLRRERDEELAMELQRHRERVRRLFHE